jgi:hypothetical protein
MAVDWKKQAAIWSEADGFDILVLPDGLSKKEMAYSAARCITADGKTVVVSFGDPTVSVYVYTLGEDGIWNMTKLPMPTEDPIFHQVPQFASPMGINDGATRIMGRYRIDTGLEELPFAWEKNADGEWVSTGIEDVKNFKYSIGPSEKDNQEVVRPNMIVSIIFGLFGYLVDFLHDGIQIYINTLNCRLHPYQVNFLLIQIRLFGSRNVFLPSCFLLTASRQHRRNRTDCQQKRHKLFHFHTLFSFFYCHSEAKSFLNGSDCHSFHKIFLKPWKDQQYRKNGDSTNRHSQ